MTSESEHPQRPAQPETGEQPALPWAQVAAELRAYREEQRRAWGDVDSTTLGRYLAGEGDPTERQQVEQALEELPELRKLTELVRDVLEDFEPVTTASPSVVPFSAPAPFQPRKGARRLQYASLALAASVLLSFGLAIPYSSRLAQLFDLPVSTPLVASREPFNPSAGNEDRQLAWNEKPFASEPQPGDMAKVSSKVRVSNDVDKAPSSPVGRDSADRTRPQQVQAGAGSLLKGGRRETEGALLGQAPLVRQEKDGKASLQTVAVLNQTGEAYQEQGNLTKAAASYSRAHQLCLRSYGPAHPETLRSRNNLAQVYEAALNSSNEQVVRNTDFSAVNSMPAHAPPHEGAAPPMLQNLAQRPLEEELLERSPQELKTDVVPVLVESLREARSSTERQRLALALGRLGPAAQPAVPVLVETLQKRATEPRERVVLLSTLGQIGPGARQALPALVSSVSRDTPEARRSAARALVEMGPAARGAVPYLLKPEAAGDPLLRDVVRHLRGREGRIGVCDECDCFSALALTQARNAIRSLANNAEVEVLVETAAALPTPSTEPAAPEAGSRSIRVLIGKQERAVRVWVAAPLQEHGITPARLARAFAGPLRHEGFDASLRAGIRFITQIEKPRMPTQR